MLTGKALQEFQGIAQSDNRLHFILKSLHTSIWSGGSLGLSAFNRH